MRRWKLLTSALCAATLASLVVIAVRADSDSDAVLAVEHARTAALVNGDLTALDAIVADDVTYTHASGKRDTKTSYFEALRSGQLKYVSWYPVEMHVRVFGDTAILNGLYDIQAYDKRVQPDLLMLHAIFLSVYARRNGRWQQVAWQTTRIPDAPAAVAPSQPAH
jgi:ketosteroid isomerase-like protein